MNTEKLITAYSEFMHHLHETMEDTLNSFTDAFVISKEKIKPSAAALIVNIRFDLNQLLI